MLRAASSVLRSTVALSCSSTSCGSLSLLASSSTSSISAAAPSLGFAMQHFGSISGASGGHHILATPLQPPHSFHRSLQLSVECMRRMGTQAPPESVDVDSHLVRSLGPRGQSKNYADGYVAPHPGMREPPVGVTPEECKLQETLAPHHGYDGKYLESIAPTHLPPKDLADRLGLLTVRSMRAAFDLITGYGPNMTEAKWLQRFIFLESVAGVPGMVSGMLRHLHSLRLMRRDKGWIPCLLEEAENERMHLLTFFEIRKPGPFFRACVLITQGVFFNVYFIWYLLWPKFCHSFVGYLEEEAVRTYTHALRDMDQGKLFANTPAPGIARVYWSLAPDATMRDVLLSVRADEACHSHVNHTLKGIAPTDVNPFLAGKSQLP